ncbi:hypothetical protein LTR17_019185 [Elasticomyces elasticus]|nr:hypothetical protein LTR17_019185 [Elasticomyces elasticus]
MNAGAPKHSGTTGVTSTNGPFPFGSSWRLHAASGTRGVPASARIGVEAATLMLCPRKQKSHKQQHSKQKQMQTKSLQVWPVRGELAALEQVQTANDQVFRGFGIAKEVSPWLELTRWPEYLRGHRFHDVAKLVVPPSPEKEPVLLALCDSLERVVKEAHQSICNDRVNVFDQVRINSFLQRPGAADRPLMVKLQRSTWRTYTRIWQSLLCFIYRTSRPGHPKAYRYQLTS